jgi:hypothetical protein
MVYIKFMQSLDAQSLRQLRKYAKKRGIRVQEYIRAVVIPGWLEKEKRDKKIMKMVAESKID